MKRVFVLTLALLLAPALVSAQVEIGLDAGFEISNPSEPDGFGGDLDNTNTFALPTSAARVAFAAGDMLLIESMLGFSWASEGDDSLSSLLIMPGINYLLGEQFYVRGEVGLLRVSFDFGDGSESETQYAFGGAVGLRQMLGDAAVFRAEVGVDRWLEDEDAGLLASTDIRIGVGLSAVIN